MSIRSTRILILLAVVATLFSGYRFLLSYAFVLTACLELLHHTRGPMGAQDLRVPNALSVAYLFGILLNRSRTTRMGEAAEQLINFGEHVAFALVICLLLLHAAQVMGHWKVRTQHLLVFIGFNLVGLGNEWFQNLMFDRALFALDGEATKDLAANAIGSALFALAWWLFGARYTIPLPASPAKERC